MISDSVPPPRPTPTNITHQSGLNIRYVTEGVVPAIHEAAGAALVTVGLGWFVTGTILQARRPGGDADVADGGDGGGSPPAAGSGETGAAVALNESVALLGSIQVTK